LISTAFVAIGIAFEYPEVKHEFTEWLRSRKKPWVVDPVPTSRNRVPLWSLLGFLIVTAGVAGEGVYEGLLGINDTKIRKMDEPSLTVDELQIAKLQNENLILQKEATDASLSAQNAASGANEVKVALGEAKKRLAAVGVESDALEVRMKDLNKQLDANSPRGVILGNAEEYLIKKVSPFKGQPVVVQTCGTLIQKVPLPYLNSEAQEKTDAWAAMSQILIDKAKWGHPRNVSEDRSSWDKCSSMWGMFVVVNEHAPTSTMEAAKALSKGLTDVLPPGYWPILMPSQDDLGLPPIDQDAAWTLV
jgi:hypothetical protein